MALKDYFHQPKFLWTPEARPASLAIDRCVLLRVLHYFCFRFLLVYASGFPVAPGFSAYLLTSKTESCDEDDEVGVEEELVDKPRTTNGTQFEILQSVLLQFLVRCGF